MCLVTFQALQTLWMKEMKGRPIDNMWMFTGSFTQAMKHSPNLYTVQALVSLFMPQRLYEYGGTKLAWVCDSMLKNWQNLWGGSWMSGVWLKASAPTLTAGKKMKTALRTTLLKTDLHSPFHHPGSHRARNSAEWVVQISTAISPLTMMISCAT